MIGCKIKLFYKISHSQWEVVVAQLVERSLLLPEVHGWNPVIGKNLFISNICYCQLCIEKMKIKKKRPGMAHFFKKKISHRGEEIIL